MGAATLQDWQEAQTQLDRALDTFLDVCSALHLARYSGGSEFQIFARDRLDLVAAMERKMAKSAALLRQVRNASSTIAPINRLPPEILARTFAFCLPPFPDHTTQSKPHPLFMITQVCAEWRRVATTTPSLWSQIMIDYGEEESPPKYISMIKQTRMWLDRANGVPLSVHLQMRTYQEEEAQITDILLPHLSRITRLSFYDVTGSLITTMLRLLWEETGFDALSALDLEYHQRGRPLELSLVQWTSIHNLQELNLSDLHFPSDDGLQLRDLTTILANSPGLRILRLHKIGVRAANRIRHPDINLPALRRLEIGLQALDDGLRFLLPILRPGQLELDVVLVVPSGHSDSTISSLQAIFRSSNVVTLDVEASTGYTRRLLTKCLDLLPNIHTLTLGSIALDSFFASIRLPHSLNKLVLRNSQHQARAYENVAARLAEQGIEVIHVE